MFKQILQDDIELPGKVLVTYSCVAIGGAFIARTFSEGPGPGLIIINNIYSLVRHNAGACSLYLLFFYVFQGPAELAITLGHFASGTGTYCIASLPVRFRQH